MAKREIRADYTLRDICNRYGCIQKKDIEAFGPVFYPIASIEVEMHERIFEDFDVVQESVLRFAALGFKGESAISDLMGLTEDYVADMLRLLMSYGHIDKSGNVTKLGKSSLEEGKKITLAKTNQIFLLDALNCDIVRIDKDLDRTIIEDAYETNTWGNYVPVVEHSAGISKSDIERVLKESRYSTLKRMHGGININVVDIGDVTCRGIRYVKAYMLKLKNRKPMVFIKRYDGSREGWDRFFWLPFSVGTKQEQEFLGEPDVHIHSAEVGSVLEAAYKNMMEYSKEERAERKIMDKIVGCEKIYKIRAEVNSQKINVKAESFFEYSNNILRLLEGFDKDGVYPFVDDSLSGQVIFIYPDKNDELLMKCAERVRMAFEKHQYEDVIAHTEFFMAGRKDVINSLNESLEKYLTE